MRHDDQSLGPYALRGAVIPLRDQACERRGRAVDNLRLVSEVAGTLPGRYAESLGAYHQRNDTTRLPAITRAPWLLQDATGDEIAVDELRRRLYERRQS